MATEIVDGIPVWVTRHRAPCNIRVKEKKPGVKPKEKKPSPLKLSPKARRELSIKQRKALKGVFEGKSKKQAGLEAGFSEKYAIQGVNHALEIASGNQDFVKAMEKQGITSDRLAEVLSEGLAAKNPFRPKQKDFKVIHSFWQDAVRIMDAFPASKIQQKNESRHIHLFLTKADYDAVEKYKKLNQDDREQREHRQETET